MLDLKGLKMVVGVISDTHGVISDQALNALQGVGHILHAGDIGGREIVKILEKIAPVTAVRGNMDGGPWADTLPAFEMTTLGQTCFYLLHNLGHLDLDPKSAGIQVVVSGHTHSAEIKTSGGVVYFNPGSASSSRFGGPLTIGRMRLIDHSLEPEIIKLG